MTKLYEGGFVFAVVYLSVDGIAQKAADI